MRKAGSRAFVLEDGRTWNATHPSLVPESEVDRDSDSEPVACPGPDPVPESAQQPEPPKQAVDPGVMDRPPRSYPARDEGLRRSRRPAQQPADNFRAHRPGSLRPQSLTGTPPEPTEAGGPGARITGPVVCCFSQQQLGNWAACTIDPWVVSTLTRGYELQFRRRPQAFGRVKMTVVRDPTKAAALAQELSALLAKGGS
ncbi:unnamed protein product [Boreogadus saida]